MFWLPLAKWRIKKLVIPLLILIQQTTLDAAEVEGVTEYVLADLDETTMSDLNDLFDPTGQKAEDCSNYDINTLPEPRIILLGPTGIGKSTLANQLLGRNPNNVSEQVFGVGHGVDSKTVDITWVVGNWLGDGPCFTIIDTPGTSDSEGRDYKHALAMANIMKEQIKSVNIFLLCFSGEDLRFHQSIIDLLKLYESIFSKEMWKHAVTEVTFWSHDARIVRKRKKYRGMDELTRHKAWNSQYKEELNVTIEIPSVYIDPILPIFDDEEKEFIEDRENMAFEKYTGELFQYGKDSPPFSCDGNCKSPNGYFLGKPWIKKSNITERQGEKTVINCQIWNGIEGKASHNVTLTHDGEIIYEKTTSEYGGETFINTTDVWGSQVKFVETTSPGEGHFSDFTIEFEALDESMEGNYSCENGKETNNNVAEVFMKVDGSWGEWTSWGQCSKTCLGEDNELGFKKKFRAALPPRNGGNPVNPLDGEDTQYCAGEEGPENPVLCPKDFSWNPWTPWSKCSPKCGNGTKSRVRSCNQGSNGGAVCDLPKEANLSEQESKYCKIKDCPDCIQLEWQEWSQCTKTCNTENQPGTRFRQRTTEEADPNDPQCNPDDHIQQESCNTFHCPIDGVIGQWTEWSPTNSSCSKICKSDTQSPPDQSRTRICIKPKYGGKPCPPFTDQTLKTETRECPDIWHCPIDCQWNEWEPYSECSRNCGAGKKTRRKTRKRPAQHGGKNCTDLTGQETQHTKIIEEETCHKQQCPPCKPSPWTSWSPSCPAKCDRSIPGQTKTRKWVNPDNYALLGGTSEDCSAKEPDTEPRYCDGMDTLAKQEGWDYATVISQCAMGYVELKFKSDCYYHHSMPWPIPDITGSNDASVGSHYVKIIQGGRSCTTSRIVKGPSEGSTYSVGLCNIKLDMDSCITFQIINKSSDPSHVDRIRFRQGRKIVEMHYYGNSGWFHKNNIRNNRACDRDWAF